MAKECVKKMKKLELFGGFCGHGEEALWGGMAGVLAKLLQGSVGLVGRVLAWRFAIRYLLQPGRIRFAA